MKKVYYGSLDNEIKDVVLTDKKKLDGKQGYGVAYWQYWDDRERIGHDSWGFPIYGDSIECYAAIGDYFESKAERDRQAEMIPKITGFCGERKYGDEVSYFTFTWKYEGKR